MLEIIHEIGSMGQSWQDFGKTLSTFAVKICQQNNLPRAIFFQNIKDAVVYGRRRYIIKLRKQKLPLPYSSCPRY